MNWCISQRPQPTPSRATKPSQTFPHAPKILQRPCSMLCVCVRAATVWLPVHLAGVASLGPRLPFGVVGGLHIVPPRGGQASIGGRAGPAGCGPGGGAAGAVPIRAACGLQAQQGGVTGGCSEPAWGVMKEGGGGVLKLGSLGRGVLQELPPSELQADCRHSRWSRL